MNLVEKLIKADKGRLEQKETKKIHSKRLSKLLGEDTEITIQEISGRRMNDFNQHMLTKKGDMNLGKMYDANLLICTDGIVDPSMKDGELMERFGAKNPKDLVETLFGVEANSIAAEIVKLCGLDDEAEEEIKN